MATAPTSKGGTGDGFTDTTDHVVVTAQDILPAITKRDPDAVQDRIIQRQLKSSTLDELFSATKGSTSDEMDGKSIEVLSVQWDQYESDHGPIPLAVCEYVDLVTGEVAEFATTARSLVGFLYQAEQIGVVPFKARIVGKKTRNNQTALNFERL